MSPLPDHLEPNQLYLLGKALAWRALKGYGSDRSAWHVPRFGG